MGYGKYEHSCAESASRVKSPKIMAHSRQELEELRQNELETVLPESTGCLVSCRVSLYPLNRVCQKGLGHPEREGL